MGEARALYNLGNVYHAKGKSFGCPGPQEVGEFPEEVRNALQAAVDYYEWVALTQSCGPPQTVVKFLSLADILKSLVSKINHQVAAKML